MRLLKPTGHPLLERNVTETRVGRLRDTSQIFYMFMHTEYQQFLRTVRTVSAIRHP